MAGVKTLFIKRGFSGARGFHTVYYRRLR
jgi:hypothetical protein